MQYLPFSDYHAVSLQWKVYVLFYQKCKHAMSLVQFENNAPFFRIASIFVAADIRDALKMTNKM